MSEESPHISSLDTSQQVVKKHQVNSESTLAVHSLLSMSTSHVVRESDEQDVTEKYNVCSSSPELLPTSRLIKSQDEDLRLCHQDKMTSECLFKKAENVSPLENEHMVKDKNQKTTDCSGNQIVKVSVTTDSCSQDADVMTGDLAVLTQQVKTNSLITEAYVPSAVVNGQDSSEQQVATASPHNTCSSASATKSPKTVILDSGTKHLGSNSPSPLQNAGGSAKQKEGIGVHEMGENAGYTTCTSDEQHTSSKTEASTSQSEQSQKTLECSFTESDDSDENDPENSKKTDDSFFRITFDSDDTKSSSGEDDFLTCSVCGKELPETAVAEGGKEMCNTCKLVRNDPEELQSKVRRGRKKASEITPRKMDNSSPNRKLPKNININSDELDTSVTPVRKSTRKRISTIVIEEVVQDSDEEGDNDAADSYQGTEYTQLQRKSSIEKKEKKGRMEEEITKSKYAQELNLTPVVKSDPDGKDNVIITQPEVQSPEVINVEEMVSKAMKYGKVKRKKGRPKGSKNKPKLSKLSVTEKESKRDMKFNKRWHRGRGPVPDANPDAADGLWSCEFCGKAFPIRRNFLAHRRKHSGRHKCDECGETFECNSKLQRHIRRHRGEKPFACHLCPKAYSENMWLQRHLATHLAEGHTPQPKPYQCNICGRQYTHKGTMIYHVKTHTETKFYQCDVCGKQFTHRSSLECHIKTHTGEKPYVCEICGKRFADRSVQLRHTRSHSGEKPYKCSICDKGFTQSGTLNIHMRMHTSEKPYKCKVCEMGFMKRCDLSRHSKCHVGEMLTKQANLITCRVEEGRGADIQKKATQILIDAYGEKKDDGTIEIKTRQFEQLVESEPQEITSHDGGGEVSSYVKSVELPVDHHQMDINLMRRPEPSIADQQQLQHEEIQRRAMEYIIMKRQELEQQEMERIQLVHQPLERSAMDHVPIERHVIEHQTVEVVTEQHPTDRQIVEQQIERHVEQHAAQRQLLEQVEGQVIEQQHVIEGQQLEQQRMEQMSPQQQAIWICKYN